MSDPRHEPRFMTPLAPLRSMRIATVDGLADEGVRLLEGQGHEVVIHLPEGMDLGDALAGFDAVIVRSATQLDEQTIRRAGQGHLRAIGRAGVGVDNIDVTAADRHGDPSGERTRRIDQQRRGTRPRSSPQLRTAHPRSRPQSSGRCLGEGSIQGLRITGKRLGLLGFGRIAGSLKAPWPWGWRLDSTTHICQIQRTSLQMSTDSIRSIRWFVSQPI